MFGLGEKRWRIEVSEDDSAGIIEEFITSEAQTKKSIVRI